MSTSMLVSKMRQVAAEKGYACEINAYASSEATLRGKDASIILLGPQIRFQLKEIQQKVPCPVEVINMADYGTLNANNILQNVMKIVG